MFVVMNPACDLVVRGEGKTKTEQILLVGIDSCKTVFPDHPVSTSDLDKKQQGDLKTAFSNKKSPYYHWLPETDFFKGGFLNFRKICTLDALLCEEQYEKTFIQIAPSFIKDMVARFSAYYARQGQPDIDFTLYFNSQENKC